MSGMSGLQGLRIKIYVGLRFLRVKIAAGLGYEQD